MSRRLAEILAQDKIISIQQFEEAERASGKTNNYIPFLIEKKYVSETKLTYYLSKKFGLPSINLNKFQVRPEVSKLMTAEIARKYGAIPIQANKGTLVVAVWDPTKMNQLEELKFMVKMNLEAVLTSYSAFDEALGKYYAGVASVGSAIESFQKGGLKVGGGGAKVADEDRDGEGGIELVEVHDIDTGQGAEDAPIITLVNGILSESIRRGASDIHVEPYEKIFRIRLRTDGALVEIAQIPIQMKRAIIARFKIMSRMDIAETRVPQDGRIKLRYSGREIDFRVNSLPTLFGEKIVLRLLNTGNLQLDMRKLGFEAKQLEVFDKGIRAPNGMVLVTGPTGSGKTTTLYSALSELNQTQDNLSTVEDPVEYNLVGVNQVQIHKEVGLTFASVLRALLRQDPDTVLVGEIRDFETAEVAVQAALTGHLVLSTLHTNDAVSTLTRLMNMGLEPFLVVASVNTIVAQRLVRRICTKCKEPVKVPEPVVRRAGFTDDQVKKITFHRGRGCKECNDTGFKGRVAIYEVLDFSPALKELVLRGATAIELQKKAVEEGMQTLRVSALSKAVQGMTTLEEGMSITVDH